MLPAKSDPEAVVGPETLNKPMFEMFAEAVINEFADEKVAVNLTVFDEEEVAAVTADLTTEPEPFVETSPESAVSPAAGAPPVPSAA